MRELANDGFVKHGGVTPNVARDLPKSAQHYVHALITNDF
jgi:hypothetical protein